MNRRDFIKMLGLTAISSSVANSALASEKSEKLDNIKAMKIDTSHWKTFAIGRYFIDLPSNAIIKWLPLKFQGEYKLQVVDITLEEAAERIREEAKIAKNTPHEKFENCLVYERYKFQPRGKSPGLVKRVNSSWDGMIMKHYFETRTHAYNEKLKKILYYENEIYNTTSSIDNAVKFLNNMMTYTFPHDESVPFWRGTGTYFEGGHLKGPYETPWPTEEIGASITLPNYSGIELSLYFNHARRDIYTGIKEINAELAGRESYEELRSFIRNGVRHFDFEIKTPSQRSQGNTIAIYMTPYVRMTLENPIGGVVRDGVSTRKPPLTKPSFASLEEAFGVWKALKESLRWRPESTNIDGTEDPEFDEKFPSPYFYVNKERVFVPYPPVGWEFKE